MAEKAATDASGAGPGHADLAEAKRLLATGGPAALTEGLRRAEAARARFAWLSGERGATAAPEPVPAGRWELPWSRSARVAWTVVIESGDEKP